MKYKIIFGLAFLIFLVTQVSAVIVTQQQLDSINATTYNLQCQRELINGQNYITTNGFFTIGFSCLTIRRGNVTGEYEVNRKTFNPRFSTKEYFDCRDEFGRDVCIPRFVNVLQTKINQFKDRQRELIRAYQTAQDTIDADFRNANLTG